MDLPKRPDVPYKELESIFENSLSQLKIFYILKSSIDLRLYDRLKDYKSFEEISDMINIKPTLSYYILEILTKIGLVEKKDTLYKNSKLSNLYLNSDSQYYKGKSFILTTEKVNMWEDLMDTMKGDIKKNDNNHFPLIIQVMGENSISGDLYDVVKLISNLDEFKKAKRFLEIGGGHGFYTIALSNVKPDLESFVFDLPSVVVETKRYIEKYSSKVKTIAGDFYTDSFGEDFDIIFSSYNPSGKNPDVAKKVYESLNVGGLFLTKQNFPSENEGDDLEELLANFEWNLTDLTNSKKGKRSFTFKKDLFLRDYLLFLEDLGFEILNSYNVLDLSPNAIATVNDKIVIAKKVK
ncbi:MAG: class I SAM-dependent methyltransferase [Methanobrevibacter sp.]|jgi:SAM-dependent methyltransferase|nr:class I SAM-dependent methyltransferase [Candidatus Methanovirga aequatorialis]